MKTWRSENKNTEKIIAFGNNTIYKANPAPEMINTFIYDLETGNIPTTNIFSVPVSYIRSINLTEGKPYIEILFGSDSYEHVRISDDKTRSEVFDYFKQNLPAFHFSVEKYSILKAGKKPLIAMIVIALIFSYTLFIAIGIANGNDYDVAGKHYNSLAGIILVIAYMGIKKVCMIFGTLLLIALAAFYKKAKNPPVINKLVK